jgi:DNA-binding helix-hairpin-helix protein with protein kinase domain
MQHTPSYTNVLDRNGAVKQLGAELARGGEGTIYPLTDRADILVKCYHDDILQKNRKTLRDKLQAMVEVNQQFGNPNLSWPLLSVFNDQGEWVGYAMRRVSGIKLHCLAHAVLYKKHFPNLTRVELVQILLNLVTQVEQLHQQGVMIGDYNLNNFMCDPQTLQVGLIDCDSYQVQLAGVCYPCPVGSPDLTPKEHHGMNYADVVRDPQSEVFSLAIILFKCLMLGRHPYDVVGGEDPVSNLKAGNFPYGKGNSGIPKGDWYNIWSHMPYRIKNLFVSTFVKGATDQQQRPSLADWKQALQLYQSELNKGWHESAIRPAQPKPSERHNS